MKARKPQTLEKGLKNKILARTPQTLGTDRNGKWSEDTSVASHKPKTKYQGSHPNRASHSQNKIQRGHPSCFLKTYNKLPARPPQSLKTTWNFSGHPSCLLQTQHKIPATLPQSLSSHKVETKFKRGHPSHFELKTWTKFKRGHLSPALHKSKQNSREDTPAVFHKATKTKFKQPVGRQAESGRTARWAACWAADWASSWTAGWTASYTTYGIWLYGKLSLLWLWGAKNCMATFCQRSSRNWSNRGRSDKSKKNENCYRVCRDLNVTRTGCIIK